MAIHRQIAQNIVRDNADLIEKSKIIFRLSELDNGNKDEDDVADAVDWVFDQVVDLIPAQLSPEDKELARDELHAMISEQLS